MCSLNFMTFYDLQNSVKLPPKMQEMAFHVLQIPKYFQDMPRTRVDLPRAFVAPFVPHPHPAYKRQKIFINNKSELSE